MSSTMQAAIYTEYGGPDVLHLAEVEQPTPQDDEVLVRVHANSINFGDLLARNFGNATLRDFHMPAILFLPTRLTFGWNKPSNGILGSEFSGVVAAVGAGVSTFTVGDPVFGYLAQAMGGNAEYLTMKADGSITHKPSNMSHAEAATVPYGALTALSLLKKVDIQPGQTVLINGASGSIGSAAVQLAKHYGAEVTGVAGQRRHAFMQALGADHVIDYKREDFTQNGERYDVILDILGKSSFAQVKHSLTDKGVYMRASFKMKQVFQMLRTSLWGKKKVITALAFDSQADLEQIRELVEAGVFTIVIDRCYPLAQAADAHHYVETGQKQGEVVIVIRDDEHDA